MHRWGTPPNRQRQPTKPRRSSRPPWAGATVLALIGSDGVSLGKADNASDNGSHPEGPTAAASRALRLLAFSKRLQPMSALPPKADIRRCDYDAALCQKQTFGAASRNVVIRSPLRRPKLGCPSHALPASTT